MNYVNDRIHTCADVAIIMTLIPKIGFNTNFHPGTIPTPFTSNCCTTGMTNVGPVNFAGISRTDAKKDDVCHEENRRNRPQPGFRSHL